MKNKMKPVRAWGGFCDGVVLHHWMDDRKEMPMAVYKTKQDATCNYVDVRRVEIREVPKRRRKARRKP